MNTVEIYTTPTCTYCKMAKEYFQKNNITYAEYDVSKDRAKAQEMIDKVHQLAVPVIVINGTPILGFNKPKIDELLGLKH